MYIAKVVHIVSYTMLKVAWCHPECCVPSRLNFEGAGGSFVHYVRLIIEGIELL